MATEDEVRVDLPLNFHPVAVRALVNVTPFGAVSVPRMVKKHICSALPIYAASRW